MNELMTSVKRSFPVMVPVSLSQTPSQQAAMLDNDQEGLTGSNQWAPYSLGRRDVPPDTLMKKVRTNHSFCLRVPCFIQPTDGRVLVARKEEGNFDNVFFSLKHISISPITTLCGCKCLCVLNFN